MTTLPATNYKKVKRYENNSINKLDSQDRAFHDWYRFVLSFPPHLVRNYIDDFGLDSNSVVLDPFCGTGTTVVEAKLCNISSLGVEANPFAYFASAVKTNWEVNPLLLLEQSREIAKNAEAMLRKQGIEDQLPYLGDINSLELRQLSAEEEKLILANSISPLPLHKVLILLEYIKQHKSEPYYDYQMLALANTLVFSASNLHFGPEVGVGKPKDDAPVVSTWLMEVKKMLKDLERFSRKPHAVSKVYFADARNLNEVLPSNSVNAVITSPPYPNEKDYTRITRLESVILGFINNSDDLRSFKKGLIRSNTRNVYKGDDDDQWIDSFPEIQQIADAIEKRRIELEKTSGFERLYSKVTKLYFGGMARHLANLRPVLKPNAQLAYVVGDQASYLRVMIRTGKLLGDIAQSLGYEVIRTDLFRTRIATATKSQLREEVVVLRWKG